MSQPSGTRSRRDFLKLTLLTSAGVAAGSTAGLAATKDLRVLHGSSFIKAFDAHFQRVIAPTYEKLTGVKVVYDLASVGSLQTRVTTASETKAGPDITAIGFNWAWLYDASLVDVTDVATEIGKKLGGWHDLVHDAVVINGKWKAIPWGNIGQLEVYRTDWFKEVGVTKFPDTWEELYEVGKKLKAKGHPFGFELGHGFGDNHGWMYPLLWSYGGREVDKDGKTVLLDSDETARAVDFCRKFFRDTMLEDCMAWTDVSNNKAYLGQQVSCTNNASSILEVAIHQFPEIAKVTDHALNPQGPKGRFHVLNPQSHAIFAYAKDVEAAKAFLRWVMDDKQYSPWLVAGDAYYAPFVHAYDNHPMWNPEPRYIPYRESLKTSRLPGWPGPPSQAMSESMAKYVICDMFAKAAQGTSTKDVIAAAVQQLKQIYKVS